MLKMGEWVMGWNWWSIVTLDLFVIASLNLLLGSDSMNAFLAECKVEIFNPSSTDFIADSCADN